MTSRQPGQDLKPVLKRWRSFKCHRRHRQEARPVHRLLPEPARRRLLRSLLRRKLFRPNPYQDNSNREHLRRPVHRRLHQVADPGKLEQPLPEAPRRHHPRHQAADH